MRPETCQLCGEASPDVRWRLVEQEPKASVSVTVLGVARVVPERYAWLARCRDADACYLRELEAAAAADPASLL